MVLSDVWQTRNETNNFNQRHEVELVKEEKRKVVEAEIRREVMLENACEICYSHLTHPLREWQTWCHTRE